MNHLDPLLQVLIKQGGDRLSLHVDQPPQFARGVARIKLFLPPFDESTLITFVREVSPELAQSLEDASDSPDDLISLEYKHTLGLFEVSVTRAPLSILFELRAPQAEHDLQNEMLSAENTSGGVTPQQPLGGPLPSSLGERSYASESEQRETRSTVATERSSHRVDFSLQPKHVITPNRVTHSGLLTLIELAAERGASDVHLATDESPMIRVDGKLRPLTWGGRLAVQPALSSLLTESERRDVESGVAIDRGVELNDQLRLRFNIYLHSKGWGASIRLLRKHPPPLESLNLPLPWREILRDPHGLFLVCGPTGSGKSTTLAALAQLLLRDRGGVLVSLEDPIEYQFSSTRGAVVRQREVGLHVSSFAEGLRAALREDPDIILIGEMRDTETIQLALTAAETGHLVLSSLHSRSAVSAVERVIDSLPTEAQAQARMQLADSLRGVVSQRLIPKHSGTGRVAAVEYLRVTHSVASMIREQRTTQITSAIQAGGADGMILLERSLAQLVMSRQISAQDGEAASNQRQTYQQYLGHYSSP